MNGQARRNGNRWRAAVIGLASTAGLLSGTLSAQSVAQRSNLAFGTIMSGTSTSIDPHAAGAMSFQISGLQGLSTAWYLTLPSVLTRTGGGATMTITFCSTCGVYRVNDSNPTGGTTFNPATGVSGVTLLTPSTVYVWIGAALSPPLQQSAGSYTGTIVLTIGAMM